METSTEYKSSNPMVRQREARKKAMEKWAPFVSSAEALLKVPGMSIQELAVNLQRALQYGSLEASLPKPLIEDAMQGLDTSK